GEIFGEWAVGSEALDLRIDHARIEAFDPLIPETQLLDDAGSEVLDKDVARLDQRLQKAPAFLGLQVACDALLVCVEQEEIGGIETRHIRGGAAPLLAPARSLHLDDLRSQPG